MAIMSRNIVVRSVARIVRFFRNIYMYFRNKAQDLFDSILNYFITWLCRYYQRDMAGYAGY